ncbi:MULTISPECIES: hypothetical protein [unclassified Dyella]|uniref:hypothetical protein n=1 Tax=unclassified Dyella TaxID=2634549 RepID=UPI003F92835B
MNMIFAGLYCSAWGRCAGIASLLTHVDSWATRQLRERIGDQLGFMDYLVTPIAALKPEIIS